MLCQMCQHVCAIVSNLSIPVRYRTTCLFKITISELWATAMAGGPEQHLSSMNGE